MKNVVITVLAILVVCLGGYLVYDKFIYNNEVDNNKDNNNENIETKEEFDLGLAK